MLAYKCCLKEPPRIERVRFKVLSADDIRRMSVVRITETTIYHKGAPTVGGINDHRMGTVDRRILCGTCGLDVATCQGHPGHIELPFPVYHSSFFDTTCRVLRCVCFMCSRVFVSADETNQGDEGGGKYQLAAVYNAAKAKKRCAHCDAPRPTYAKAGLALRIDWPADAAWQSDDEKAYCTAPFTSRDALSILENISDEDALLMGFDPHVSHPRNMVLQNMIVPPPAARPAIMASEGSKTRGQDDLTQKLQEIMKRSIELAAVMGGAHWCDVAMTPEVTERLQRLQYDVFTIVNNSVKGHRPSTQRSGIPTKSLIERIKGKDGRIRGNLMGKRVDFSARSVISPGPSLDIDQVGVPHKIALQLTVPEKVNAYNMARLTARVAAGAGVIGGAECLITADGVPIQLAHCTGRGKLRLAPGCVVERYLEDDDVVIFNRQPSLHKMGMMGHRVKLVHDLTFRLNLSVTGPYNADFDGDEMNLHVPQSAAARASVRTLMMVTEQIISPQASKPCVALVQDALLGCYRASHARELFPKWMACHVAAHFKHAVVDQLPPPCVHVHGEPRWSGKQLFSLLLDARLQLDRAPAEGASLDDLVPLDSSVVVHDGTLLCGRLNKAMLGSASGGLIDLQCRDFGNANVSRFVSDTQRFAIAINSLRGFNVGIADCVLDEEGDRRVEERINKATRLVDEISNELRCEDVSAEKAALGEVTIRKILSKALMQTGSIVECSLKHTNAIKTMVLAGSKGSPINLSQIAGCVGQQSVEGRRITPEKGTRTLPCFQFGERSLASQGFVRHSYAQGLRPHEFFFHAMGGREGLVDTAVKTATTGYIQRRQVKSMENNAIKNDGTVRNGAGNVIQFTYGGSGWDASRLERLPLGMLTWTVARVRSVFAEDAPLLLRLRDEVLAATTLLGRERELRVSLPVHPARLRRGFLRTRATRPRHADGVLDAVFAWPSATLRLAFLSECPPRLLAQHEPAEVRALVAHVTARVAAAAAAPGEMVGCIAAQSIGEPTTQMSAAYNTPVLVSVGGEARSAPLGAIVDTYLPPISASDQHDVAPVSNLRCAGVSPSERVAWANVTHVSRHPAGGDMLTVTTRRGRSLRMTASHSFLVRDKNRVVQRRGSDLVVGDALPVVRELPSDGGVLPSAPVPLNRAAGRFVGAAVAESTARPRAPPCSSPGAALTDWVEAHFGGTETRLPAWVLDAPDEFAAGLLQAYFDGAGTMRVRRLSCRARSTELAAMLCLCLARHGIATYVDRESGDARVTIPMCFAAQFQARVGFGVAHKAAELAEAVRQQRVSGVEGFRAHIPGMREVLEEVRAHVPPEGDLKAVLCRSPHCSGVTPRTLMRCRAHAVTSGAPGGLVAELDQAIRADVWWDPIVSIEVERGAAEMVYDLTVGGALQSFLLSNGVFVHNTLNTFHSAGIAAKNVTLGIPRLQELLTVTKSMRSPCMTLRFRAPFRTSAPFVEYFGRTLPLTTLGDAVLRYDIVDDPDPQHTLVAEDAWTVNVGNRLDPPPPQSASRFVVRLQLNKAFMQSRFVAPADVRRVLRRRLLHRAHVLSSEHNDIEWVVRVRLLHVDAMMRTAGMRTDREAVMAHRCMNSVMNTLVISGNPAVSSAAMRTETAHETVVADGALQHVEHEEHVVDTCGVGLLDVAVVSAVDWYRCQSNDVLEVLAVLGIEAAANVLYDELLSVISFDGTYVYPGHLLMIVDTMTRDGRLKALNRFGVNRDTGSSLARATFEETPEILTDAAVYAENGAVSGVSTNIILGQPADVGTGAVRVLFHSAMLPPHLASRATQSCTVVKSVVRPATHACALNVVEYDVTPMDACLPPYRDAGDVGASSTLFDAAPNVVDEFRLDSPNTSDEDG